MPVLKRFTRRYPLVEVEVLTADGRSLRQRTDVDSFQAMIVSGNSGLEGLEILRRDRLHWIGSVEHQAHIEPH